MATPFQDGGKVNLYGTASLEGITYLERRHGHAIPDVLARRRLCEPRDLLLESLLRAARHAVATLSPKTGVLVFPPHLRSEIVLQQRQEPLRALLAKPLDRIRHDVHLGQV
jgi:hypothetical protein